jgi:ElaA protein
MKREFLLKSFAELSAVELYRILRLRSEVFIVEQNCPYQDLDNKDSVSWHLMHYEKNELIGYARILPPGVSYPEPSIGRVAVALSARRKGVGRELMKEAIEKANGLFPQTDVVISAQSYLLKFYTDLGFDFEGEGYEEDGIPHIRMRRKRS